MKNMTEMDRAIYGADMKDYGDDKKDRRDTQVMKKEK